MSNQGQKVKKSIFDFQAKIGTLQFYFSQMSNAHLLERKNFGNHEIN